MQQVLDKQWKIFLPTALPMYPRQQTPARVIKCTSSESLFGIVPEGVDIARGRGPKVPDEAWSGGRITLENIN